ncbi:MAG: hypothetical protein ABIR96_10095 [Bdellovibrionota bacterium]
MQKVQFLRFLNLGEIPQSLPPGDLRLWKALAQNLPEITFRKSRVLCVEWPESTDAARLPDLSFWNERIGISGVSSLAFSRECDVACLQSRRLGLRSSELETLIEECLREAGFNENFEVWEATHYEFKTRADIEVLEENVLKLLMLESRSGLFDKESEDIRFMRPGETWAWSRRNEGSASSASIALADLIARFKDVSESGDDYDSYHRPYQIREQQARGPAPSRRGASFRDRLAAIQKRSDSDAISVGSAEGCVPSGVISAIMGFHRFSDLGSVVKDLDASLRKATSFSDDDCGAIHWIDVGHHHTNFSQISQRKQNFRKANVGGAQLFALNPIHAKNALLWRRFGALIDFHRDLMQDLPWIFSGRESWLAGFRNFVATHLSWEISEKSLRKIFAWEGERSSSQSWIVFSSQWNQDRVRDAFRDFGFEVSVLGTSIPGKDNFGVKASDGAVREFSWIDVLPNLGENAKSLQPLGLSWTGPDLKTPTYGFEKVSIFPDQYLLRLAKLGSKGALSRKLQYSWRSSGRAREVSQRAPFNTPLSALKWARNGDQNVFVDAVSGAAATAAADPKSASVIALETCYRNLVARAVDPRSAIYASFSVNRPIASNSTEKDIQNFGSHILACEGFFESMDSIENLKICEASLDRSSSLLKDYECEPVVHLRGQVSARSESVFPGFRMNGEALYAVGPRPAFMDLGSTILQHVRVVSNHVTRVNWAQQMELYDLVYRCIQEQIITDLRPIMWGGIAETLLEMGLWSGIGIQLKPSLSTIELFSAAPGRFLVGVLPQEAKKFESMIKGEWLTPVGTTGGEKLFGLPLERYREEREAKV